MRLVKIFAALVVLIVLAACGQEEAADAPVVVAQAQSGPAKQLFGARSGPSAQSPAPFGSYSRGCLAGGARLPETGPTWQAMRLSRNRNWAHPQTVDFVQDLSRKAAALPGTNGLFVGDLSQPRGGPMLTGHRSHQIGMDADIWLMPASLGLSVAEREAISAVSYRRAEGAFTNSRWSRLQHEVVKAAAKDPRTARIFIFPGAKVQMCRDAGADRAWLRKVRPWYGHHYHFHVRLSCPRGASGCVNQDPPPPGDGCAEAQDWVNNILSPPPPRPRDPNAPAPQPRRELTMADLPNQCQAVLAR